MKLSRKPTEYFAVYDTETDSNMIIYISRYIAQRFADKRNLEYGAHRFAVRRHYPIQGWITKLSK